MEYITFPSPPPPVPTCTREFPMCQITVPSTQYARYNCLRNLIVKAYFRHFLLATNWLNLALQCGSWNGYLIENFCWFFSHKINFITKFILWSLSKLLFWLLKKPSSQVVRYGLISEYFRILLAIHIFAENKY